jgi:hypothetical protein
MRWRGNTGIDDWNPITLLWMMTRRECWHCGIDWKDRRWGGFYTWYDGPMWHVFIGPLWIAISY